MLFSELTAEPLLQPLLVHMVPPFDNRNDPEFCLQINGNFLWECRKLDGNSKKLFAVLQAAEVKFSSRNEALQNETKTSINVLPFITAFSSATPNIKKILRKHWHLITVSNRLGQMYSEPPIVAYRKDKSLKDLLVRAKIPSHT